jgi:hypothetical protein
LDLQEESIDIVIQPEPKKGRIAGSSPVSIRGPLAGPEVKKIPLKEAGQLAGEIAMPYVFLSARVMGYVWNLMENDKDEQSPCLAQDK